MRLVSTEKDKTSPGNRGFFVGAARRNAVNRKKTVLVAARLFEWNR